MILLERCEYLVRYGTKGHRRLGSRTDTGHRQTDVNGRADTTEEELSLQEDLTIGNGNNLQKWSKLINERKIKLALVGM